ncbi:MAG: peptidase-C39 like family protein [Planctomycetes bacterium]|nr:peptidase-C39 like family protein [Planctomycetota bacterium]
MEKIAFDIRLNPQPTDTTCGPTCLHGIYNYLGMDTDHHTVISDVATLDGGGTLGVHLATDAVEYGLGAIIYTHNLKVFDPTWFKLTPAEMRERLIRQSEVKSDKKICEASVHYAEFLSEGGAILFEPLTPEFLRRVLESHGPLICGLSATYLYMTMRERNSTGEDDDIEGFPQGHFVLLCGISGDLRKVEITDPLIDNPLNLGQRYELDVRHFINSILIGVITYDANLIAIFRKE